MAAAAATMLIAHAAAAAPPAPGSIHGTWTNPRRSVAVRTGACGERLCGWIVWANAKAVNDARAGGTPNLIGTALLEDYRSDRSGRWSGTVFVPDLNRRFPSVIQQVGPDEMKVRGCLLRGLLCKSQLWRRIADVPRT